MKVSSPFYVQLELTYDCNLKCSHCYNPIRHNGKSLETLTDQEFHRVAEGIVEAEVYDVVLTGGEPTIKKNLLFSLIEYFRGNGTDISINSNMTLFNDEDLKRLYRYNIKGIMASLHSPLAEKNRKVTNYDSFEITKQNIRKAIDAGLTVSVDMVLTKDNIHDLYAMAEFVKMLGTHYFMISPFVPQKSNKEEHTNLMLSFDDIVRSLDVCVKISDELGIAPFFNIPLPKCLSELNKKYKSFLVKTCTAGDYSAIINPQGDVKSCIFLEESAGNLLEESLKSIWNKRENLVKLLPEECNSCNEASSCAGSCRGYSYFSTGQLNKKNPYMLNPLKKEVFERQILSDDERSIKKGLKARMENKDFFSVYGGSQVMFFSKEEMLLIDHLIKLKKFRMSDVMPKNVGNNNFVTNFGKRVKYISEVV